MRIEDAPPPGWYPDPDGGARLRWWEGADWSDRWRAPPTPGVVEIRTSTDDVELDRELERQLGRASSLQDIDRRQSQEIITQVRQAARDEAQRAAEMFGQQARSAAREIEPLISQYTGTFIKWVRIIAVIGVLVGVAWVAWQIFIQVSLFDWIGDRIDNLTDNEGGAPAAAVGLILTGFI